MKFLGSKHFMQETLKFGNKVVPLLDLWELDLLQLVNNQKRL